MPSDLHETLIRLFRDAPEFTAALLQDQPSFGFDEIEKAILVSENASVLQYAERRVDGVIELLNKAGDRMGVALEVQLDKKENKLFSWPTYLARLREDLKCPVVLLVICKTNSVARWAADPIILGPGSMVTPVAIGPADIPRVTDPDDVRATAEMAALSAITHAGKANGNPVLDAMNVVFSRMEDQDRAVNYTEYVRSLLNDRARHHLEALLSTATFPYHNAFTERYVDQGRIEGEARGKAAGKAEGILEGEAKGKAEGIAEGKAEGEANAVLRVLDIRGIEITAAQRDRITGCTDLDQLGIWLDRAVTAKSSTELFAE